VIHAQKIGSVLLKTWLLQQIRAESAVAIEEMLNGWQTIGNCNTITNFNFYFKKGK
jgi:hypothetical protein